MPSEPRRLEAARRHSFAAGETLTAVAEAHGLSGWQGLYYAAVNRDFRRRYPDPWRIPPGARIRLPTTFLEQQQALTERLGQLARLRATVRQLLTQQRDLLTGAMTTRLAKEGEVPIVPGELIRGLAATTLRAIDASQAGEDRLAGRSLALAEDALERWPLVGRPECATLFSLLARAAATRFWVLPAPVARAWCEVHGPNFWARQLIVWLNPPPAAAARPFPLAGLRAAQDVVAAQVDPSLAVLRTTALMERNRLARQRDRLARAPD